MLSQFTFSNFKSFSKEALLDFTAEPAREHADSVLTDKRDSGKFLPVIAIYGSNGGGKSTVLEALAFLRSFVLKIPGTSVKGMYHKFDPDCKGKPVCFDVLFRTGNRQYRYQLSLLHNQITGENLYMQPLDSCEVSIVFERSASKCLLGGDLENIYADGLKGTMPLLAFAAESCGNDSAKKALSWFKSIRVANYEAPLRLLSAKPRRWQLKLCDLLQKLDIPIFDFRMEMQSGKGIIARHTLANGKTVDIPLDQESRGTKKLICCLADMLDCLETGALMIADDLGCGVHSEILRAMVELFTDPKNNRLGAQLLFTSHNTAIMTANVFRRDELWFCARSPQGASTLYSFISFKSQYNRLPEDGEDYGTRYLAGDYGADPCLRLDWGPER